MEIKLRKLRYIRHAWFRPQLLVLAESSLSPLRPLPTTLPTILGMSEPQTVDVSGLSLQQLADIRKQLEAEVDHLSESSYEIRRVLAKFMDCSQSVKQASTRASEGSEIMVPLTESLYVPGRMEDAGSFLVDVGTNYYVEKNGDDTVKFFDDKVRTLSKNLIDLDKLLNEKVTTLRNLDIIYKEKFQKELKEAKPDN